MCAVSHLMKSRLSSLQAKRALLGTLKEARIDGSIYLACNFEPTWTLFGR